MKEFRNGIMLFLLVTAAGLAGQIDCNDKKVIAFAVDYTPIPTTEADLEKIEEGMSYKKLMHIAVRDLLKEANERIELSFQDGTEIDDEELQWAINHATSYPDKSGGNA